MRWFGVVFNFHLDLSGSGSLKNNFLFGLLFLGKSKKGLTFNKLDVLIVVPKGVQLSNQMMCIDEISNTKPLFASG